MGNCNTKNGGIKSIMMMNDDGVWEQHIFPTEEEKRLEELKELRNEKLTSIIEKSNKNNDVK